MKTCLRPAEKWQALRTTLVSAFLVMTAGFVTAQEAVELNPDHPDSYVVEAGDTLWDISKTFLRDPWYWPEIWHVNPQVENPHLIFPGDVLNLAYVDGQPRVQLTRSESVTGPSGTERVSPAVRYEDLDSAIPSVSKTDLEPFIAGGMILDKSELEEMAYVVALRDHMIAGAGHEIYARGIDENEAEGENYLVLRVDEELRDPESGDKLGYEVMFVGKAQLRANGDPATLFLTDTNREILRGDRVRKADITLPMNYFPSAPEQEVTGQIISVVDGLSRIGQYQMIMLNRGTDHGLTEGNVMAVWQTGRTVNDDLDKTGMRKGYGSSSSYSVTGEKVKLPDTFAGNVMVIKAYEDISYALVMEAVSEMRVLDRVTNP